MTRISSGAASANTPTAAPQQQSAHTTTSQQVAAALEPLIPGVLSAPGASGSQGVAAHSAPAVAAHQANPSLHVAASHLSTPAEAVSAFPVPASVVSSPVAGPAGGAPLPLPSNGAALAFPSAAAVASAAAAVQVTSSHFEPPPRPVFSTSFKSVLPPVRDYRRIKTENVHQFTFYMLMPVSSFLVRALLHPLTVIKTRMMVISVPIMPVASASASAASSASVAAAAAAASKGVPAGAAPGAPAVPHVYGGNVRLALSHILKTEGFRGLYSGFGVSVASLAVGPVYMATMLTCKEQLEKAHKRRMRAGNAAAAAAGHTQAASSSAAAPSPASSSSSFYPSSSLISSAIPFVSGGVASCIAQCLGVPLDVIANKQMRGSDFLRPEGSPPARPPRHAWEIARDVWQRQGLRGFYRGYWLTLMHNAPMSAMVWGVFENLHPHMRRAVKSVRRAVEPLLPGDRSQQQRLHPSLIKWDAQELALVGVSAGMASAVAATATLPLDVIKTRLQTSRDPKATVRSTFTQLLAERGWKGLRSGLNARLASAVPTSALLMVCFEVLKRATIRADAEPDIERLLEARAQHSAARAAGATPKHA